MAHSVQIHPVPVIERGNHEAVWAKSPQTNPFAHSEFVARYTHWFPRFSASVWEIGDGQQVWGGFTGYETRFGGFRRLVNPPLLPYTSPWAVSEAADWLPELVARLSQTYDHISLELHPAWTHLPESLRPWARARKTFYTNLTTQEDFVQRLHRKRRAEHRKTTAATRFDPHFPAAQAVSLIAQSYHRHGRKLPVPEVALTGLVHDLVGLGLATTVGLWHENGTPLAATVVLQHETMAYHWLSGSVVFPAIRPAFSMMIELIEYFYHNNLITLDLCGANHPTISTFKQKFADQEVPYYFIEQTPSRILSALEWIRKQVR